MQSLHVLFCLFLTVIYLERGGDASKLPGYTNPCSLSDPNLETCLKEAVSRVLPYMGQEIPELGIPVMDPMDIGNIKQEQGALSFNFKNGMVFGLKKAKIDSIKINQSKRKITLTYYNTGGLDSDYVASGRLLILPITGAGKSVLNIKNMLFIYKLYYDVVKGEDGKDYWIIKKHKVTYSPEKMTFHFEGLFNGNKQLSDVVHQFANDNWQEIFTEIGKPLMIKQTNIFVENLKKFFSSVPVEDYLAP